MYYPNNKTKCYLYEFLYNKSTKSSEWVCRRVFDDWQELLNFVAASVETRGLWDCNRWKCAYFSDINVNLTDGYDNYRYITKRDEEGFPILNKWGYTVYEVIKDHIIYPYHFEVENGTIIDVRKYKKEIYALVYAQMSGLIELPRYRTYYWRRHGHRPKSHTCIRWHPHSKFYRSSLKTHTYSDEYNGEVFTFKPKPKDKWAYRCWWDDFCDSDECGWKAHKHKKQWMHRLDRQNKGVWVDKNYDKKSSSFDEDCFFYKEKRPSQND